MGFGISGDVALATIHCTSTACFLNLVRIALSLSSDFLTSVVVVRRVSLFGRVAAGERSFSPPSLSWWFVMSGFGLRFVSTSSEARLVITTDALRSVSSASLLVRLRLREAAGDVSAERVGVAAVAVGFMGVSGLVTTSCVPRSRLSRLEVTRPLSSAELLGDSSLLGVDGVRLVTRTLSAASVSASRCRRRHFLIPALPGVVSPLVALLGVSAVPACSAPELWVFSSASASSVIVKQCRERRPG